MKKCGPYKQILRKPRYLRQRDLYSCGVIALLNALKWAGYNITYRKDFDKAKRACKCTPDGVYPNDFDVAIRRYKKLIVLPDEHSFEAPSIKLLDEHLALGGAFVLSFIYKYHGVVEVLHMTLCIGKSNGQYVMVNNSEGAIKTISKVKRKTMIKMLRYADPDAGCSEVWFLFRLDNLGKR
jgi:hypothetical protein